MGWPGLNGLCVENIQLNSEIRERLLNCCGIDGSSSHNDQVTKDTILQVYINSGDQKYVLDPHTAIGVHAAMLNQKNSNRNDIVFCMACAHPSKFSVAIEQALNTQNENMNLWKRVPRIQKKIIFEGHQNTPKVNKNAPETDRKSH